MTSNYPQSEVPEQRVPAEKPRRFHISPRLILAALIVAIATWFILVNTRNIRITLWVKTVTGPLWLVLLITVAAGTLLGMTLLARRRRRRRR